MPTSEKQPESVTSADECLSPEERLRNAFERLKLGIPAVLPKGTSVTQNNVAKEAGYKDPSALRRTRFPLLVLEIQEWGAANEDEQPSSERQRLRKQRGKNRSLRETIADLTKQRDKAEGLLVDADLRIVELTEKLADLQAQLDRLKPKAPVLNLSE